VVGMDVSAAPHHSVATGWRRGSAAGGVRRACLPRAASAARIISVKSPVSFHSAATSTRRGARRHTTRRMAEDAHDVGARAAGSA